MEVCPVNKDKISRYGERACNCIANVGSYCVVHKCMGELRIQDTREKKPPMPKLTDAKAINRIQLYYEMMIEANANKIKDLKN